MGTVLIDILKGKSENEISDYVVDFKKKMVNRPTSEIAKNSQLRIFLNIYQKVKEKSFQL